MATYVLIPGAGGSAEYWSRVVPVLERAGHQALAVDLPGPDRTAGLPEYVDLVVAAAQQFSDVVLVAQSLGGFTAPMAAERLPVREVVLVNAMVPVPGETPGQWWRVTGAIEERESAARRGGYGDFDVATYFLHDVDTAGLEADPREESDAVFGTPSKFTSWPCPTRVLTGADDRFFPPKFQERVARERLGTNVALRPGGHLIALAQPQVVADFLLQRTG
ncbi:alpha/beta fold hydrolase [Pengzhenrongella phosphoraccumulans]|uniref:alpha/beta fold hydrolase n=1 Tax=Pengzhenrongella phosphoraccumulans TaxID=3114394 RepID=UPI00388FA9B3